ncbi:COG1470 family protein [Streptomyces sp. TE33382]
MPPLTSYAARAALTVLLCALSVAPATAADSAPRSSAPSAWEARPTSGTTRTGEGGRPYFYLEGAPGTVLQDRLTVTNPGRTPLTVRLRGADADRGRDGDGEPVVRDAGKGAGAGAWLRFASRKVTVPARTRAEVPFALTVPPDTEPGDHPGAILAESGGRAVGVRVHLRVSGPTLAALSVEDVAVSGRTIRYTLVNRGNAALTPRLSVSADGMFGALLRREARTLPRELLPGERVKLTEPWRDAPALDSVTVRLRATAAGGAHGEASASATYLSPAPLAGGALLVLALLAAAGAYRRGRRPGRGLRLRPRPGRGRRHPAPDGGTGDETASGHEQDSDDRHVAKAGAET